jgi:hypothetical protein
MRRTQVSLAVEWLLNGNRPLLAGSFLFNPWRLPEAA